MTFKDADRGPIVTCHLCDTTTRANYMEPIRGIMVANRLCFNCYFWTEKEQCFQAWQRDEGLYLEGKREVFNGPEAKLEGIFVTPDRWGYVAYAWDTTSLGMRGFGGRAFRFKVLQGRRQGEYVDSNNVWSWGQVPSLFLERGILQINAEIVRHDSTGRLPALYN